VLRVAFCLEQLAWGALQAPAWYNAPDLIKGESEQVCRRWGVHITSSAPYEPRQNSAMERRWCQHGEDSRVALAQSNFLNHSSGEKYWWYAWRDAEIKDGAFHFSAMEFGRARGCCTRATAPTQRCTNLSACCATPKSMPLGPKRRCRGASAACLDTRPRRRRSFSSRCEHGQEGCFAPRAFRLG
jgi:hypothetical protein